MNDLDTLLAAANPVDAADLSYGPRQEMLLRSIIDEPAPRPIAGFGARPRWTFSAIAAAVATAQDDGRFPTSPARAPGRPSHVRWVLPVAVAAAMVTLVTAITVTVQGRGARYPVADGTAPAGTPLFYAASVLTERRTVKGKVVSSDFEAARWGVYDSRTGKRTADLPDLVDSHVAGLGDGRTFFIAGRDRRNPKTRIAPTKFIRVTLTADGRIAEQVPLPLSGTIGSENIVVLAASPEGRRLAFSVQVREPDCKLPCSRYAEVRVVDVGTGKMRRWRSPNAKSIQDMSWAGDGGSVVFTLFGEAIGDRQVRVLDIPPDGSISSRVLVTDAATPVAGRPGASTFVMGLARTEQSTRLAEFSTTTGKRVLDWKVEGWFNPLAFDSTGRVLLGWTRPGKLVRVDGERLVPIAMPELPKGKHLNVAW
ncbi:hypothetical protein [Sphaerisporangium sp. NPDC051011]|uniref:hypothetical protein n=1 Tax=Sphaerisporangium sp. NPDC051011 TaxID=3155792 RepID=UPI0033DA165E